MIRSQRVLLALAAFPGLAYLVISAAIIAAMACKVGTRYSFNVNEGWNAFWADAAWSGADLYPPVSDLKLNNYPPIWFYLTGGIGHLVGDNIRAGRAVAAVALLLNGAVVSLIARELGAAKASWLAAAAFVAIFGLFYQDYAAANDPQILANLLMMIALLLVVRSIGQTRPLAFYAGVVLLMLVAGLTKHSDVGVPLSVALFFLLSRSPRALLSLVGLSIVGVAVASAGLYLAYGKSIFSSVLLPRPYDAAVAWAQTRDQLAHYGLLLAVIPFLAFRSGGKARLVLIYAVVALIQGAVLSGGYRVDVNVFFDLLFCVSIGLGVMGAAVMRFIRKPGPSSGLRWTATACWMAIALLPPLIAVRSASEQISDAFDAVTDASYEADLRYIRSTPPGKIICEDLALCYWAGQPFNLDLNNLRTIVWSVPALEDHVVAQIDSCEFSLIELNDDPDEPTEAQITHRIGTTIESRYEQVRETAVASYWRPRCG
jgi:hypothetical protein